MSVLFKPLQSACVCECVCVSSLTVATILLTAAADCSSPLGCSTIVTPRYLRWNVMPSSRVSLVSVQFSGSSAEGDTHTHTPVTLLFTNSPAGWKSFRHVRTAIQFTWRELRLEGNPTLCNKEVKIHSYRFFVTFLLTPQITFLSVLTIPIKQTLGTFEKLVLTFLQMTATFPKANFRLN